MRLFVSVDLPDALAGPIADLQEQFEDASGLDFTDPEQAHVTLKFLGDTPEHRLNDVTDALETAVSAADVDPFEATFGGLGVFPSLEYISVLWFGVESGAETFCTLQKPIEEHLVEMGFEPEDHEFTPHVTLARMNHAGGKELVQSNVETLDPTIGTMTVEEVRLTESTLAAEGPVYETRHRVEL
ncbi:MAG: RNA 2',3'-cyclic phosphodiesterase [Halodesulfurarchaeum sp.]